MTKKQIIGRLLMTPFLIAAAGAAILILYIAITEHPMATLGVAVILAAIAGFFVLEHDPEDTM